MELQLYHTSASASDSVAELFYPRTHLKVLVIDATRIYQQIYLRPLLDQRGRACFQPPTHNILLHWKSARLFVHFTRSGEHPTPGSADNGGTLRVPPNA